MGLFIISWLGIGFASAFWLYLETIRGKEFSEDLFEIEDILYVFALSILGYILLAILLTAYLLEALNSKEFRAKASVWIYNLANPDNKIK